MIYINRSRVISKKEWEEIINRVGVKEKILTAKKIVIKPNFAAGVYVDPRNHVVSNLDFISNVIQLIYDTNSNIEVIVAESDSTGHGFAYAKFEHLGLPASLNLPSNVSISLLDMTRDRLIEVKDTRFRYYKDFDHQLWLSKNLLEADFIISLSNLKTHTVTGYTGACKNLFGCLPDFDKSSNHTHIHKIIHDLVLAIKPDLNIVDAFYGMEGNGPVQGQDVDSGYRVISDNPLEADIYSAWTVGINPNDVKYLKYLSKTLDFKRIYRETKSIRIYKKPVLFVRVMNTIGLFIQNLGQNIALFGHRIHCCTNFIQLCIAIVRPILLYFFSIETLREMKRKLLK